MFKIIIKNLKLFGYHGINPEEKTEGQEFLFNVTVTLNKSSFKIGIKYDDNISSTVNYSDIINLIKEVNSIENYDLLETLSESIARKILSFSPLISEVKVKVEKTSPPIKENLESVGVLFNLVSGSNNKAISNSKVTVYLSIGSNIGDREKNLREAVRQLAQNKNIKISVVSSIYETEPMYVKEQDYFYNIAVKTIVNKSYSPFELLGFLKEIEYCMGRKDNIPKYGPRIIDLDILLYNDLEIVSDILIIPHPKIAERNFVLEPLSEIVPGLEINGKDIKDILKSNSLKEKVFKCKNW